MAVRGVWEALKNKLNLKIFYYSLYFIKLQVTNEVAYCGYGEKIKPVKMLN